MDKKEIQQKAKEFILVNTEVFSLDEIKYICDVGDDDAKMIACAIYDAHIKITFDEDE